jgi:membrane protein YdbS with pleckstrin-like domain
VSRDAGAAPGIGSITALAFVVVLVPAILVASLLSAFGASLAVACMLGLLTAFIGMGLYPTVLKRLGWLPDAREDAANAESAHE